MNTDVVLLPGMHGSTVLFDTFILLAPSWARCRALSLPTETGQGFSELAVSLAGELSTLERFVLVGESFSGPVAAHLSMLLEQKVQLLVLCNPLVQVSAPPLPGLGSWLVRSPLVPPWGAAWLMTDGDRQVARAMLREVRRVPRKTLAARIAAAVGATSAEIVSSVSADTLVLVGSSDRLLNPSRSRESFSTVPHTIVVELDAPHLVIQTHPAEVWKAISDQFETAA